ncbi:hypothetical protein E8A74_44885 [Polyangium fumosum]|uniref:Disintegrin domain-containing protein n=2 Tax=Polyangium fumosum TaxID=889272 RepID=A0A4V6WQJ0_9BACT|nr:hypothetical protein E8A74_44885 [Polyangium fumosum]
MHCGEEPKAQGAPSSNEVAGDCKQHTCDAAGSEQVTDEALGTACGDATASCANGVANQPDTCDDAGTCQANDNVACAPYACSANACATTCAADADCAAGNYCNASGMCAPKVANGASCAAANACQSGFCADGVCCNTACNGLCLACDGAGTAGTCTPVAAGTPDPACGAGEACSDATTCLKIAGTPCGLPDECISNVCTAGECAP